MIDIFLAPFYDMLQKFIIIVVILSIAGIVFHLMKRSLIWLIILFVFFIVMATQPSTTYMNIFFSAIKLVP